MNNEQLKNRMASLLEEDQDALAQLTLMEIKKRSELRRIAAGSMWTKYGLFAPIIAAVAILGFRESLADNWPLIIVFLLFVIYGVSASIHSRIDAIYELMKVDQKNVNLIQDKQAEQ